TYSIVPLLRRPLAPDALRGILAAIRDSRSIRVHYQSKSAPEPRWRWLSPHALGFDGWRWHARAWCHTHSEFRDFVLTRFIAVGETGPAGADPASDLGWQREVTLRLAPHPSLREASRRAVEMDFGMAGGQVEVTTRVCLASYFLMQMNLDDERAELDPERQ